MIRRPPRPTLFPYPPLFRSPPPSPAAPPSQGVRLNAQRILHLQDLDRRVPGVRHADVHARRSGGAVARPLATPDRLVIGPATRPPPPPPPDIVHPPLTPRPPPDAARGERPKHRVAEAPPRR